MSLHELRIKVITIDMVGQEFEPKRRSIMQREKQNTDEGKSGKILKVEI